MSNSGDGNSITLTQWQALGFDLHSVIADPETSIFENVALNDFALKNSSQAIDIGTNLVAPLVIEDLIKNMRPTGLDYDIGAYEYQPALAVTYTQFDIKLLQKKKKVVLTWKTANEVNNDGFEIHKKGVINPAWKKIGWIDGNENSSTQLRYYFEDLQPTLGMNYYRLKQVDLDGHYEYSEIKKIFYEDKKEIEIYPNPATSIIYFDLPKKGYIQYQIFDQLGHLVISSTKSTDGQIDISTLRNGIYVLHIFTKHQKLSSIFEKM